MRVLRLAVVAVMAAAVSLIILWAILLIVWGGFMDGLPHIGATTAFAYWFFLLVVPLVLGTAVASIAPAVAHARRREWTSRRFMSWGAGLLAAAAPVSWFAIFPVESAVDVLMFVVAGALAGAAGAAVMWDISGVKQKDPP